MKRSSSRWQYVIKQFEDSENLFRAVIPQTYDLIIANPPYVRTQVMDERRIPRFSR